MPNLGLEIKRRCGICGKVFIIKTLDSLYCCKKCSDVAYARKKRAETREKQLALIAKSIPTIREFISIREAVAIYGVERDTLYLMVRRGQIPSINIGTRLTRINRKDLEKMFVKRPIAKHIKETPLPKKYSLEPEDCYTIGEVCETHPQRYNRHPSRRSRWRKHTRYGRWRQDSIQSYIQYGHPPQPVHRAIFLC